ncbi:MAG: hypothetical protein OHK0015_19890 [Chloroflexi bacterium OHK40]
MSAEGNDQQSGTSPGQGATQQPFALACPWCDSARVEQVGVIGSHLMVAQYICLDCRCPFEWIRR